MCGILGALPFVDDFIFQKALRTIAHRGPDGEGIWQGEFDIMLGHRRLSILDISEDASQPMHFNDRYHIVFNGEIYNFVEIRRELELLGHVFISKSDTEVLLRSFVEWGEIFLSKLNGMWAFAIWDSFEKKLFLSRDRMGEKPIYYIHDHNRFIFASEQKALLPFLERVIPSDNFQYFAKNSYIYESTEETLFAGIKRFPAAHFGWYQDDRLEIKRYWCPTPESIVLPGKYEDRVEYLRYLLLDSCKLRLRSDVPVGTSLSGGVDSSAIASSIAQVIKSNSGERIPNNWHNAFVASFPNTVMDESIPARRIANYLNINFCEVLIKPENAVNSIENWAYLFEDIHEVNPIPQISLYKKMREDGVLVSLDGHGGDELFCGYESSILHALPSTKFNIERISMILDTYAKIHPQNDQFKGMSNLRIVPYLLKSKYIESIRVRRDKDMSEFSSSRDSLGKHLTSLTFGSVLPTLLRNYDRYSMINGVEIRIPLLDPRIIDFAFALPWEDKIRGGFSKSILRDAVKPWLPNGIVTNRAKIGFAPPIIDWMKGPLREYLLDEISSKSFDNSILVNSKSLKKAIRDVIYEKPNSLYQAESVWRDFSIFLWEKAFLNNNLK